MTSLKGPHTGEEATDDAEDGNVASLPSSTIQHTIQVQTSGDEPNDGPTIAKKAVKKAIKHRRRKTRKGKPQYCTPHADATEATCGLEVEALVQQVTAADAFITTARRLDCDVHMSHIQPA